MAWPGSLAATAAGTKEKRHEGRASVALIAQGVRQPVTHSRLAALARELGRRTGQKLCTETVDIPVDIRFALLCHLACGQRT